MAAQLLIIISFGLVSLGILLYFYSENREQKKRHLHKEIGLIEQLVMCHKQLKKRQKGLNNYDFLQYNLSEALIIQLEIKIL